MRSPLLGRWHPGISCIACRRGCLHRRRAVGGRRRVFRIRVSCSMPQVHMKKR